MRKRVTFRVLPFFVLSVLAIPVHAQLSIFDSFAEPLLDPAKWVSLNGTPGGLNQSRTQQSGALLLQQRSWGSRADQKLRILGLSIAPAIAVGVNRLSTEVRLTTMIEKACRGVNPSSTQSYFQLSGHWLNDGSATRRSGLRGNVVGEVVIGRGLGRRLQRGRLDVVARVAICKNAACTRTRSLFQRRIGNARSSQSYTVAIHHDRAKGSIQFGFGRKRHSYRYTRDGITASPAAGDAPRTLALVSQLPSCRGNQASYTESSASVNWVKVNADALR